MADTLKILGQVSAAAITTTALYTVPDGRSAIVNTFTVCNRSAIAATFRLSFDQGGTGTTNKDYVYYDLGLDGNDSFTATVGYTLAAGDVVKVYASTANLSFSAFGLERS